MSGITTLVSDDGSVYLRTQHGNVSGEIAEALAPYTGRIMSAYLRNNYGHPARYRVELLGVDVDAGTARVRELSSGIADDHDAFDAFGSYCTIIEPVKATG